MSISFYDAKGRYTQRDFGRQPPFSGFLPGIAGLWGVPAWCHYNNRGQAVSSFGVQDKDHAILEFNDAQTAYRHVSLTGFRTFLKWNDTVDEAFADDKGTMTIDKNALRLQWENERASVEVLYFILPGEHVAGLCRRVTVTGRQNKPQPVEILDGLATIVPYGLSDDKLKKEAHLSAAWFKFEHQPFNVPYFSVRASLDDHYEVHPVCGKNFCLAFTEDDHFLPYVIDPNLVFGWDTSLRRCVVFETTPLEEILLAPQLVRNTLPCCFTAWSGQLETDAPLVLWSFYGQTDQPEIIPSFCKRACRLDFFESKYHEAILLGEKIVQGASCKTGSTIFDGYVVQNYLDNVLRGGLPISISELTDKASSQTSLAEDENCLQELISPEQPSPPLYVFGRRHGDSEREYNFFSQTREYFSQGNGSFRDICQNRRSDVWFCPEAGRFNLKLFFELLQIDGYNPLIIHPVTYRVKTLHKLLETVPQSYRRLAAAWLEKPFTPGELAMTMEDAGFPDREIFLFSVIAQSEFEPHPEFQDGYWSDHWTYLLDLVEQQFALFPDTIDSLLWGERNYRWYRSPVSLNPQEKRYAMTPSGLRQNHFWERRKERAEKWETEVDQRVAYSTLGEKLILLCAIKYATLDLTGAAIEMEGGKPGWCDAVNGLPALLGSSVPEACELLRLSRFLLTRALTCTTDIELYQEIAVLLRELLTLEMEEQKPFDKWIERNRLRDRFRSSIEQGFSGKRTRLTSERISHILASLSSSLHDAIDDVTQENNGICPTYFRYDAPSIQNTTEGVMPKVLNRSTLPLFLEGPARFLRAETCVQKQTLMAKAVRRSALFDQALGMYKICAPLNDVSFDIGRIASFPPGWLENESIWLHMEYKYLHALLESKQYTLFLEGFNTMLIPNLPLEVYKRSTLENSSFLLSSASTDEASHGRGYQARLTGSTSEFISIWHHMLFGNRPFRVEEGQLILRFEPLLPDDLFTSDGTLTTRFLRKINVTYHLSDLTGLYPGQYQIEKYVIKSNSKIIEIEGNRIYSPLAEHVRQGHAEHIDVYFKSQNL